MNDSYAGPIQVGPSFMQAIENGVPYLSTPTSGRRLSESNLTDDSRTKQVKSERLWEMSVIEKLCWIQCVSKDVLTLDSARPRMRRILAR